MSDAVVAVGRFAPSPSGPLHFGSVVAAVASWLDIRAQGGRWLLRIDDLDPPRVVAGAENTILETLVALGLQWDGAIARQGARGAAYAEAVARLRAAGLLYRCRCSRRDMGTGPYRGTCRDAGVRDDPAALRVRAGGAPVVVDDVVQGRYAQDLAAVCGDFVVRRADGVFAYHLAVVVDDAAAGVTQVTRGVDLLESTPRQMWLQCLLGLPTPRYAHLPVVLDGRGDKLSKQTHAAAVVPGEAARALWHALAFLGLDAPADALGAPCRTLLDWALPRWSLAALDPAPRACRWPADRPRT